MLNLFFSIVSDLTWTEWQVCPKFHVICGFKLKVDEPLGDGGDDSHINEIAFVCCLGY